MTRLDPLMRISDHFAEALRTHEPGISDAEVRRRSLEALGGVRIPPTRFRNYPYEFSGGMRQRIMIALALVLKPRFVIVDEPTTALDVLVEAQILSIIADLKNNFDTALLLITHNLGIVAESCDRVAVMYAGRIVEQGAVVDIFSRPEHPYTQELMRSTISLSTRQLHYIPGAPPDLVAAPPVAGSIHAVRTRWRSVGRRSPSVSSSGRTTSPSAGSTVRRTRSRSTVAAHWNARRLVLQMKLDSGRPLSSTSTTSRSTSRSGGASCSGCWAGTRAL